jgi:zinc protease
MFRFLPRILLAAFTFGVLGTAIHAQRASTVPGPKGELRVSVPSIISDSLPNGLRYHVTRINDIPITDISIIVDAGLSREQQGEAGLAFAVTRLLPAGGEQRTKQMIQDYLHEQASVILPYTHYDYAQLYARALNRNFSSTMDILGDILVNPAFPESDLALLKHHAATSLPEQPYGSGERASREMIAMLCGEEHVLMRRMQPNERELRTLSRDKLVDFHRRHYAPERTTVIVTGNLDPAFIRTVLIERFGAWRRSDSSTPDRTPPPRYMPRNLLIDDTTTVHSLAYFRLGIPALPRHDQRFPALILLNSLLGDGQDSRLSKALWGRHIVSPSFTSNLGMSRDCSYLIISGSATPALADSVVILVQDELRTLANNGVTEAEIERVKRELLHDGHSMFASNRSVQNLLKDVSVYGGTIESVFAFPERLAAVTAADVNALAKELFEKRSLSVVILGNAATLRVRLRGVLGSFPVKSAGRE